MNSTTGTHITDAAHIQQSIADILTTPIGSRIMREEYGSLLPELTDEPLTEATLLQAYAAIVMAIQQWEPRVLLENIASLVSTEQPGSAQLEIDVIRLDTGMPEYQRMSIPL